MIILSNHIDKDENSKSIQLMESITPFIAGKATMENYNT